jgi:hypothetical protein
MHSVFSVVSDTTAELRGMTITGGRAYAGGGIHNGINATLTLTNSTVSGNTADEVGGGIYNSGALTLTNSTVSGNTAANESGHGGGIRNGGTATLTLTNSTVSGNAAGYSGDGGGIRNVGTATLTNSTVSGNAAKYGGGIINRRTATLTLTNSTVSGNSAGMGRAFYNSGVLTLTNSTVSGSMANGTFYTIYNSDALTVTNTVFDGDCYNQTDGTITSRGYNIEIPGNTCGFDQLTDRPETTAAELNLGELADNGGPTKTHSLRTEPEASVAIDWIPADECVVDTDQRGEPRPVAILGAGPMCDVGAFERQPDDQ